MHRQLNFGRNLTNQQTQIYPTNDDDDDDNNEDFFQKNYVENHKSVVTQDPQI